MAVDTKISALNDASEPFGSSDRFPVVQSGATKKASFISISRHAMTTASGSASDANYYAKLGTFTVSTSVASYINKVLELTDIRTGVGDSNISFIVRCNATGTIETANTKVTVNKNNYTNLAHNSFFIVQPSAGTVELWVQKKLTYSKFNVYELASNTANVTSTLWHEGATWQAAAPTGTTVTSDWVNAPVSWTPEITLGGANTGITYSTQVGTVTVSGGVANVFGYIILSNKGTATGALQIANLPYTCKNIGGLFIPGNLTIVQLSATLGASAIPYINTLPGAKQMDVGYYDGVVATSFNDSNLTNTTTITFSMTYPID